MLDKRFGATHALKTSIFEFEAVEVHAIVGGNGAGKSTLIKLSKGATCVRGANSPGKASPPHEAIDHGIN
jgi:ABC-type sugar transport system ATPase subunit